MPSSKVFRNTEQYGFLLKECMAQTQIYLFTAVSMDPYSQTESLLPHPVISSSLYFTKDPVLSKEQSLTKAFYTILE